MASRAGTGTRTRRQWLSRLTSRSWFIPMLAGIVAILAGASLPLAPVEQSDVHVTWPASGASAESTTMLLTNQTPHSLDIAFTGAAALSVPGEGGVVLSTVRPDAAGANISGLVVSVEGDEMAVATAGETWSWQVQPSDRWRIASTIDGLEITRNDTPVQVAPEVLPPQVDVLFTDTVDLDADTLSASLQLVDDVNDRPTALKVALMVVCVVALLVMLVFLRRDDLARRRVRELDRGAHVDLLPRSSLLSRMLRSLSWADPLLVGLLTLWIFIGPMTDDDGYYAVMALNADVGGYVGNYFQMFNSTFTPFTWIWQFFGFWQHIGGRSPVWLRVPSLVFAVIGWFVARWLLARLVGPTRRLLAEGTRLLLAVVTFVWWASYAIGARPEPFVAMATVVVIALLVRAYDTSRLVPAAFAVAMAAWSFATHPIGIVSAAPLLLSIPMLWRIAREDSSVKAAVARTTAVVSASGVALLAAFNDGSLYDMLTGQRRFSLVEGPLTWVDEFRRYGLLFADIPMGSYARRSVVLVALVLLAWFVVFALWSRRAATFSRPVPLSLVGWAFGLSFILMWITTSKWTHHFGALASLGPLFIVAVVVAVPRLVRAQLSPDATIAPWLMPVAVVSVVPAMIFSLRGPDIWAYDWGAQQARPPRPEILGISLANYYAWGLLAVLVIGGAWWFARRRGGTWRSSRSLVGVSAIVAVFFSMTGGYLAASFAWTASPLYDGFSVGKSYLADPSGSQCLTDQAIRLWDAATGTPLTSASQDGRSDGFEERPDTGMKLPSAARDLNVWTTIPSDGVGSMTTDWYGVPALGSDQRVAVLTSGDFVGGTIGRITAQFRDGSGEVTTVAVADSAVRPGWSSLAVAVPAGLLDRAGIDLQLRLDLQDLSAVAGADVAMSEPVTVDAVSLRDKGGPDTPTAVGWTQTLWFPCDRPMRIAEGVIEPPAFATTFGRSGIDNIWLLARGGSLAGVQRLATVNTPVTGLGDTASGYWGRVHLFEYPTPAGAYDLDQEWQFTPGWRSAFDPASQLVVPISF